MRKVFLKTVQKIFIIEETTFPLIFRIKNIKKKKEKKKKWCRNVFDYKKIINHRQQLLVKIEKEVQEKAKTYISIMLYRYKSFFFFILENLTFWKAYYVDPGEGVKLWLSQAFTRDARPDSNSRPAIQISNPLPSRYAL